MKQILSSLLAAYTLTNGQPGTTSAPGTTAGVAPAIIDPVVPVAPVDPIIPPPPPGVIDP
eukprot:CAMPEP_0201563556 /NCGR_PEP_ID=MMETSP0190_2-20130828/625_1 /ASSEMBLY_ACC=CAM_ASM_000263 /TAXON_ID=37353 /ORGANISM="Rosalina sp." /LENGTH=59 /DNA_ID=CAMNT_0047978505 /DNA_START=12 /DNA_END=187 /DNA_ORIENTATION=+